MPPTHTHGVPHPVAPVARRYRDAVQGWCEREQRYLPGRYTGTGETDSIHAGAGHLPLLITAGHSVTHLRDGERKPADIATGGLAETIAYLTGAGFVTADGAPTRDPNYDAGGTFKAAVGTALAPAGTLGVAVLDLHGMSDSWGVDVCLGRGERHDLSLPLIDVLHRHLTAAGFTVTIGNPYDAAPEHTVTRTLHRARVPAAQIELAKKLRNPWDSPDTAARLLAALTDAAPELVAAAATAR